MGMASLAVPGGLHLWASGKARAAPEEEKARYHRHADDTIAAGMAFFATVIVAFFATLAALGAHLFGFL